jgi:FixJ family two-component response regulator
MSAPVPVVMRRVAIVDDDESVRVGLRRLCRAFGFAAAVYGSGEEFLSAVESDPLCAECLILDTHMPGMSGIELQRHLLAAGVRIPTIVLTADERSDRYPPQVVATIVAYLFKPVSGEVLLAAIGRALCIEPERLAR